MAAGLVRVTILENPTALTISTALTALVAALNVGMRYTVTSIGQGKGVILTGIEQA